MYAIMNGIFKYTTTDFICAIALFLIIIKIYSWKKKDVFMKFYFLITGCSLCMVTTFAIGHLADYGVIQMISEIRYIIAVVAFTALNLTVFLWFVYSGIFRESIIIINKRSFYYCAVPIIVNIVLIFTSFCSDIFYYVTENGVFKRGTYFDYLFIVPGFYIIFSGVAMLWSAHREKNEERKKRYIILAAFIIPLLIGGTIQNLIPEANMLVIGICVGVITAYYSLSVDEVAQKVIRKNIELQYSQAELKMALEDEKRQYNTVSSLANIYVLMYYIHMKNDEYDEIRKYSLVSEIVGDTKSASEVLNKIFSTYTETNYTNMMLEFTDLSTLDERMGTSRYISAEYKGKTKGWCRARFIEVERDENGKLMHVIFAVQDISEEKQKIVELQDALNYANKKAFIDGLTGVKNVTAYKEYSGQIDEMINKNTPKFAIAIFDVNGLKYVNDNFGHEKGNMLIIDSCRCICRAFKHSPVFRIGGDEFVAIVEGDDLENINNCREILEFQFAQVNEMYPDEYIVSVATGIAKYDQTKHNCFEDVFKKADEKMYENKQKIKKRPENIWMVR